MILPLSGPPGRRRSSAAATRRKILVVDDDFESASGLRLLLESDGYEVESTPASDAAFQRLNEERFDALIVDLEVHGSLVMSLVRAALASPATPPVFVVTAFDHSKEAALARQLGVLRVFAKPLEYEALKADLKAALP